MLKHWLDVRRTRKFYKYMIEYADQRFIDSLGKLFKYDLFTKDDRERYWVRTTMNDCKMFYEIKKEYQDKLEKLK